MIIDNFLKLSDSQDIRATALATNIIDLSVNRDIGEGKQLFAVLNVETAFAGLTSLTVDIITATTNAGANSVPIASRTIPVADLTVGKLYVLPLSPVISSRGQQFLGARYTVNGANATAGTVSLNFVLDYQDGQKYYPAN